MSKEQLLQDVAEAFERLIATASLAAQNGVMGQGDTWGPREIIAHMTGWEVIATVHIPNVVAGMPPVFGYTDKTQQTVLDDALNAAMVTLVGEQPLDTLCHLLRRAYQRDLEILRKLDESFFQSGQYVYERTKDVIEHCQEHREMLVKNRS